MNHEMFRPISLESAAEIQTGMHYHAFTPSQYCFVNLFICQCKYHYQWMPFKDQVVILNAKDDRIGVPDMRSLTYPELLQISDSARQQGWSGSFYLVPEDFVRAYPALTESFIVVEDEAFADYVYALEDIVEMREQRFREKRNLTRRFKRTHPIYNVRPLEPAEMSACLAVFQQWMDFKAHRQSPWMAEYQWEFESFKIAVAHYDALQLEGMGIWVDGKLVSFMMYNSYCADTVIGHFLKYDPTIKGASEILIWELARQLGLESRYLNLEQDMGIPGVRQFKRSYNPIRKLASLVLIRK